MHFLRSVGARRSHLHCPLLGHSPPPAGACKALRRRRSPTDREGAKLSPQRGRCFYNRLRRLRSNRSCWTTTQPSRNKPRRARSCAQAIARVRGKARATAFRGCARSAACLNPGGRLACPTTPLAQQAPPSVVDTSRLRRLPNLVSNRIATALTLNNHRGHLRGAGGLYGCQAWAPESLLVGIA